MKISMLVYPDFTPLDLIGPLQVWNQIPDVDIELVAKDLTPISTDTVAAIVPTHTYETAAAAPDILFAPGGTAGTLAIAQDEATLAYMADRGAKAGWVTSVCTGALILGAAGLLKGYKSTTHWAAMDMLAGFGAEPVKSRTVIDRNRASGGGVTAGIDFGLTMMAELIGEEAAKATQLALEYNPAPPFNCGHPDVADEATVAAVVAGFAEATSAANSA